MTESLRYPNEPRLRWEHTDFNDLLLWGTGMGMSDLCLRSGLPAWIRLNGVWKPVTERPITGDELFSALERLTKNNSVSAHLKSSQSDYDFAHQIRKAGAFIAVIAAMPHQWLMAIPQG